MSLMFAALKKLEGAAPDIAPVPEREPASPRRELAAPARVTGGVLAGAALLAAVWWLPHSGTAPAPVQQATWVPAAPARPDWTPSAVAANAIAAPRAQTATPLTPLAATSAAKVPVPARVREVAAAQATPRRAPDARSAVPAGTAPSAPIVIANVTEKPATSQTGANGEGPDTHDSEVTQDRHTTATAQRDHDEVDTVAVAAGVDAMGVAIQAGDYDTARRQLDRLSTQLPAQSLTLLRMRAWLAHASGDGSEALALYRRIATRMPDDRTAAVNLALLEADNGQIDSARERLRQLRAMDSNPREIERAMAQAQAQLQ